MGTVVDDAASVEFHAFFERHYAELARLANLLTGEPDAADALLALWHRWDRVRAADHPVAYARGVVANLARTRIRAAVRCASAGGSRSSGRSARTGPRTPTYRARSMYVSGHPCPLPDRQPVPDVLERLGAGLAEVPDELLLRNR